VGILGAPLCIQSTKQKSPGSGRAIHDIMGNDKKEEKEMEEKNALKERIIAGIKAHPNHRNKFLGALPRWLVLLCERDSFRDHAKGLRTESALADYGIEQAKRLSKQKNDPWDFKEARKEEKEATNSTRHSETNTRTSNANKGTAKIEPKSKWKELILERAEWGHTNHDGSNIECPDIIKEDLVMPGAVGLAMMGWETFAEKARMVLELQGGPLAVILPGNVEDAKRTKGKYWKGNLRGSSIRRSSTARRRTH
jgi:hypothetical protein